LIRLKPLKMVRLNCLQDYWSWQKICQIS
jgi:hypothetical protein